MEEKETPVIQMNGAVAETEKAAPKVELSEEEQAHRERLAQAHQQRMTILNRIKEFEKEFKGVLEEIGEKKFGDWSYGPDSKVEISGELFAHMINFTAATKEHNDDLTRLFSNLTDTSNGLACGAIELQLELTKLHVGNCEKGICTTPEDREAAEAKENIKEVGGVKARGTKEPSAKAEEE